MTLTTQKVTTDNRTNQPTKGLSAIHKPIHRPIYIYIYILYESQFMEHWYCYKPSETTNPSTVEGGTKPRTIPSAFCGSPHVLHAPSYHHWRFFGWASVSSCSSCCCGICRTNDSYHQSYPSPSTTTTTLDTANYVQVIRHNAFISTLD